MNRKSCFSAVAVQGFYGDLVRIFKTAFNGNRSTTIPYYYGLGCGSRAEPISERTVTV